MSIIKLWLGVWWHNNLIAYRDCILTRHIYVYSYSCSRFPSAKMSLRYRSFRFIGNCRESWWLLIENCDSSVSVNSRESWWLLIAYCDIRSVIVTKDQYAWTLNKWLLIVSPGWQFRLILSLYTCEKFREMFGVDVITKQVPWPEIILNSIPTSQIWEN